MPLETAMLSCQRTPRPEGLTDPHELVGHVANAAAVALRQGEEITALALILTPTERHFIDCESMMHSPEAKDALAGALRRLAREFRAEAVVLCFEAWMSRRLDETPASEDPERTEALLVQYEDRQHGTLLMASIARGPEGRTLGMPAALGLDAESRFANLLAPLPVRKDLN